MGRARIIGNYGDGEYRVEIVKDTSMLSRTLESMSHAISQMQNQQSQAQSNKSQLQSQLATLQSQAQEYTNQLATINSELTTLQANIPDPEDYAYTVDYEEAVEQWEADLDYWYQQREAVTGVYAQISGQAAEMELQLSLAEQTLGRIDVTLSAMQARLSRMQDATSSTDTRTVWCADYSDELSGEVRTIEINGESKEILIAPHHEAQPMQEPKGGVIVDFDMMSAAGALYNWVAMPAWQLHKPTFRVGTIISIDKVAGVADVRLPVVPSSALSSLNINKAQDLLGCHIAYMDCDPTPFEEGDDVVVQFRDQVWEMGTIIGYAKEPQKCADCECEARIVVQKKIKEIDEWDVRDEYWSETFERACEDTSFWRIIDEHDIVRHEGEMVAYDPAEPEICFMQGLPAAEEVQEELKDKENSETVGEFGISHSGTSPGAVNLDEQYGDALFPDQAGGFWEMYDHTNDRLITSGRIGPNGELLGLPTAYESDAEYRNEYSINAYGLSGFDAQQAAIDAYEDWARDFYDEDDPRHPDHPDYAGPPTDGDGNIDDENYDPDEEDEEEDELIFYLEIGCYDEEKGDMTWPRD